MEIDVFFDSEKKSCNKVFDRVEPGFIKFAIACGYISTTNVLFVKENVIAKIEANGQVDFYNPEEQLLASVCEPAPAGGRERYEHVCCKVEDDDIMIKFPIYQWIDNYPHCDGEHDRWDLRTVGYHQIIFNMRTHTISREDG